MLSQTTVMASCGHVAAISRELHPSCPVCGARSDLALPHISEDLHELSDSNVANSLFHLGAVLRHDCSLAVFLADYLLLLEIRFRSRPEVLSRPNLLEFSRSLFLGVLYLVSRAERMPFQFNPPRPLGRIVTSVIVLLKASFPQRPPRMSFADFSALVGNELTAGLPFPQLVALLRQVTLFAILMLRIPIAGTDSIIDWDWILDPPWLFQRYQVQELQLPGPLLPVLLLPIPLPDTFAALLKAPYNYDITDVSTETAVDLITGTVFVLPSSTRRRGDLVSWHEHISRHWVGDNVLGLVLSGRQASAVLLFGRWQMHTMRPIYLDRTGLPDYGFERRQCLWLDRGALAAVFDDFMAGRLDLE
jgi:hypothetical protein